MKIFRCPGCTTFAVHAPGTLCKACTAKQTQGMYRHTDPSTSAKGAQDVVLRAGSQRFKLLVAYSDGTPMIADAAMRRSGVSERSCYWKRVSELVQSGYLDDTGTEAIGEQGSAQRVNVITPKGRAAIQSVLKLVSP